MTHSTSQPRFNIYQSVHKGLRAFMADTLNRVGATDEADSMECGETCKQVRTLLEVCAAHLTHENEFIHAAMERRCPGSAAQCASEHEEHVAHIEELLGLVSAAENASAAGAAAVWQRLYQQLSLFVADNLAHMMLEERDHNAVLWANYTDAEIRDIHKVLISCVPADEMAVHFRWMIPQLSHAERVAMLTGMQQGMPEHVFGAHMDIARGLLPERSWTKLTSAVPMGSVCHG